MDAFTASMGLVLTVVIWLCFGLTSYIGSRPGATRNAWAGIRIASTMKSDEAWRAGHQAAMYHVRLGVLSCVPPAVIFIFLVGSAPQVVGLLEWALAVATFVWMLGATRSAAHAAETVHC